MEQKTKEVRIANMYNLNSNKLLGNGSFGEIFLGK